MSVLGKRRKEFEGAKDPITLQLSTIACSPSTEMGITMINTSISPYLRRFTTSAAICDWENRIVSQVDGFLHTASAWRRSGCEQGVWRHIHPGDVFVMNDRIWVTHLQDVTIMKPLFYNGRLQFITINRAHHGDVGGIDRFSARRRRNFFMRVSGYLVRIYKDNKPIQDVVDMIE